MSAAVLSVVLSAVTVSREATSTPLILESLVEISSAMPSLKYALSGSVLRFFKASTAMEGRAADTVLLVAEIFRYHSRPAITSSNARTIPAYAKRREDAGAAGVVTGSEEVASFCRPLEILGDAACSSGWSAEDCTAERPEDSRRRRLRSARSSAADWQRRSRSFSSPLLMMRSSSAGAAGLRRAVAGGVRGRMQSKIAAEVSP